MIDLDKPIEKTKFLVIQMLYCSLNNYRKDYIINQWDSYSSAVLKKNNNNNQTPYLLLHPLLLLSLLLAKSMHRLNHYYSLHKILPIRSCNSLHFTRQTNPFLKLICLTLTSSRNYKNTIHRP